MMCDEAVGKRDGSRGGLKRKRGKEMVPSGELSQVGQSKHVIQWYPGHIAKAERKLKETLSLVDVIIEVRDCRIPSSTGHPLLSGWIGSRGHVLVLSRADMVPDVARSAWRTYLTETGIRPRFVDGKRGHGVTELQKAVIQAGSHVNEKRLRRGLLARPVRALVLGYPNVGKSALINRLVGRRAVKSENKPGVTRHLQWVRVKGSNHLELLDAPGIIPAKFVDQETALRLAVCDDIGQAAYDNQIVSGLLIEELRRASNHEGYFSLATLEQRYGVKLNPSMSGDEYVHSVCSNTSFQGNLERASMAILTDFRSGSLGPIALEAPPS